MDVTEPTSQAVLLTPAQGRSVLAKRVSCSAVSVDVLGALGHQAKIEHHSHHRGEEPGRGGGARAEGHGQRGEERGALGAQSTQPHKRLSR